MPSKKEALSNLDIKLITTELARFKAGFLQKAYQPEVDTLLLRLYHRDIGKGLLFIKLGSHLCLREESVEMPQKPSQFIMLTRKLLNNAIIRDIRQQKFDRVIVFELEKAQKRYFLIFEIFGTGNAALVDKETGLIIRPLIPKSWKDREFRAKRPYQFPPSQPDLPGMMESEFLGYLASSDKDLVRCLTLDLKMEGNLAEELILRVGLEKSSLAAQLPEEDARGLYKVMRQFFLALAGEDSGFQLEPTLVLSNEAKGEQAFAITPFPYQLYQGDKFTLQAQPDFNSCITALFPGKKKEAPAKPREEIQKELESKEEQFRSKLLKKLNKRLKIQEQSITGFDEKMATLKAQANQIYLNYQKYETLLGELQKNVLQKGGEAFKEKVATREVDFLKSVDLKENKLMVKFPEDEHWLTLHWKETLNQNAQRYYAAAKKLRKKRKGAEVAIEQTQVELERARKRNLREEMAKAAKHRSEKEKINFWFENFRWFVSSNGNVVVGGRDAKSNETVVKKYLRDGDRYIHADVHGAPSVVVRRLDGEEVIPEETLQETAGFAASFSRAWNAKIAQTRTYWVKPEQVSKTPNPGEFLGRGAFVIRGKRNFMDGEMKLGVGELTHNNKEKLVAGPPSAVKKHASRYLILQPGPEKRELVARKIARLFGYSTDYTQRLVPGDSMIVDANFDWQGMLSPKGKEENENKGDVK